MHFTTENLLRSPQEATRQAPAKKNREPSCAHKAASGRVGWPVARSLGAASVLCAVLAWCPSIAPAQVAQPIPPPLVPHSSATHEDSALHKMTERMAKQRNIERQKKIVADTQRLLAMAQKLNDEVTHSNKNELSIAVVKQAGEIEKLAKSIKEKMRNGY